MTIKMHSLRTQHSSSRISEYSTLSTISPSPLLTVLFDACGIVTGASSRLGLPTNYQCDRKSPMLAGRGTGCPVQAVCKTLFKSLSLSRSVSLSCCAAPPPSYTLVVVCNLMSFSLRPNRLYLATSSDPFLVTRPSTACSLLLLLLFC